MTDSKESVLELKKTKLFSGPISRSGGNNSKGFIDIVKIGAPPPKNQIWKSLLYKNPLGSWDGKMFV
ncbi:MAG: hypothetical protein LBB74_08755 [Chitinispirillales bacterium]|nr:hypothetical protein [Chitinispirillales bacterium]